MRYISKVTLNEHETIIDKNEKKLVLDKLLNTRSASLIKILCCSKYYHNHFLVACFK